MSFIPKTYFDEHSGTEFAYPASDLEKELAAKLAVAAEALEAISMDNGTGDFSYRANQALAQIKGGAR